MRDFLTRIRRLHSCGILLVVAQKSGWIHKTFYLKLRWQFSLKALLCRDSKKPMEQRHRELSATASPKIAKYVMAHLEKLVFDRSLFLIVEAAVLHCVGDAMPLIGALLDVINKDFKLGAKDEAGNVSCCDTRKGVFRLFSLLYHWSDDSLKIA